MAPVFSLMTCVMLFLAVVHSVQAADSITVNESTLKSTEDALPEHGSVLAADSITVNESTLKSTEDALPEYGSSFGGELGEVVAQLVTSVTFMKVDLEKTTTDLEKTTTDLEKTTLDLLQTKLKLQKTERTLQKTTTDLQRTEMNLQNTELNLQKTERKLQKTEQNFQNTKTDLQRTEMQLQNKLKSAQNRWRNWNIGSTFVRWGRKTCPSRTTLVYSGVAGGKKYDHKGSGTNRLCLTRSPVFDNTRMPSQFAYLYGGEYHRIRNHHDRNVPCSVCRTYQSTTIMIAGTHICPPRWILQYSGQLTSQRTDLYATEFVCLDRNPENDDSGKVRNEDGLLFFHVITICGSLPCPPYKDRKLVTCVVCSR